MKWKEIYDKCNHKMYCRITEIKQPLHLNANFKKFYTNNKLKLIIAFAIILAIICIVFHSSIAQIAVALLFFIFIAILFFYNNTYSLKSDEKAINVKYGNNDYKIDFNDLLNIYLDKHKSKYFIFIPEYTVNIIFKQDDEQMILSLPTYLLSKNKVMKFFNNLEYIKLEQQDEFEKEKIDHKNMIRAVIITSALILVAVFITTVIVLLLKKS